MDARPKAMFGWFAASPPSAQKMTAGRCQSCRSARPTDDTVQPRPGGFAFDSPAEIRLNARRMRAQAVLTRAMPLANKTGMKDAARGLLGRWIAQGAKVE